MLVYRFELGFSYLTPYGAREMQSIGPFARYYGDLSSNNGYDRLRMATPMSFQPEPEDDGLYVKAGWAYGCDTLKSLVRFFHCDLGRLHRAGFQVAVYEVPDNHVEIGGHQVQYSVGSAELIRIMSVREMKDEMS